MIFLAYWLRTAVVLFRPDIWEKCFYEASNCTCGTRRGRKVRIVWCTRGTPLNAHHVGDFVVSKMRCNEGIGGGFVMWCLQI